MPRKKSPTLTDAELRLMEVPWEKGPATVAEVLEVLPNKVSLAYSTVLTTLRVLEQKGYLRHAKEGRAFVYRPLIGRDHARDSATSHLIRRFFGGSPELLMLNLVENRKISPEHSGNCAIASRRRINDLDSFESPERSVVRRCVNRRGVDRASLCSSTRAECGYTVCHLVGGAGLRSGASRRVSGLEVAGEPRQPSNAACHSRVSRSGSLWPIPGHLVGRKAAISRLVDAVSVVTNRIVLDKTGLKGTYDIDLE